uniref:Uncharacterized protein n=1 Tax=viral metagenome TaxID=1070528 RepID=A0A6M3L4W3_9ZZZZ
MAVALCAKLDDLSKAIDGSNAHLEYGTVPCPVCGNQADNLALMLDSQNGAVLCNDCLSATMA